MEESLNQTYWNQRWENQQTGWDIGHAAPAIIEYMQQYKNKNAAILIPGCGSAHEAEDILQLGYTNITLMDIAPKNVEMLQEKFSATPEVTVLCEDFFEHQDAYDLIIEQTFFCAIYPSIRKEYVKKANSLLKKDGKIIGVLFNREFEIAGPPFGGNTEEYVSLFNEDFKIRTIENCYNSITPRAENEVFVIFEKK